MKYLAIIALSAPLTVFAQTDSLQTVLASIGIFLNTILVPFMLAVAFFIFVINAIRYFVIQGDNQDGQENAKNLALYSVAAFVFILSFWGIVNILTNGIGLEINPTDCEDVISDYIVRDGDPCTPNPPDPWVGPR